MTLKDRAVSIGKAVGRRFQNCRDQSLQHPQVQELANEVRGVRRVR